MTMISNLKTQLLACILLFACYTPVANAGFFEDLAALFGVKTQPQQQSPANTTPNSNGAAAKPAEANTAINAQPTVQAPAKPAGQLTQKELDEMLWLAALQGNSGRIRGLVERGANPKSGTEHGETPLHVAASRGHLKPLIYLANHGGSVNARTKNGWTPLHHAARFGHLQAVKYLLHMGAVPHIRTSDKGRKSPMEMAVDNGYIDIALLFGYRPK